MENINDIKLATLRALMKDDILMSGLVLKGGNALQLAYDITDRGSIDIDFSMEKDFSELDYKRLNRVISRLLSEEFSLLNLIPIDVKLSEKPKNGSIPEWKGYLLEFKLIEKIVDEKFSDISAKRRNALVIQDNHSTKYTVDISAYEYIESATKKEIDGIILRVYTPEMIVIEKFRAICQSMKEYKEIVSSARQKKRARDIYDIWNLFDNFSNIENRITKELVINIFSAKQVPIEFLDKIESLREPYRENWETVKATLSEGNSLEDYDYYFNFIIEIIEKIKSLLDK
ncbi:MAG: nucleotidyl transferase AbiEii/AbiGii toxin family protein [Cetobacterium sp.]|uniref:nucleotidyl transferase AbiEii/AbiGii toxin family protein n=1 Tax=Cetobacterium sp. TaxID=2071632 RepID=UPI003F390E91